MTSCISKSAILLSQSIVAILLVQVNSVIAAEPPQAQPAGETHR